MFKHGVLEDNAGSMFPDVCKTELPVKHKELPKKISPRATSELGKEMLAEPKELPNTIASQDAPEMRIEMPAGSSKLPNKISSPLARDSAKKEMEWYGTRKSLITGEQLAAQFNQVGTNVLSVMSQQKKPVSADELNLLYRLDNYRSLCFLFFRFTLQTANNCGF